MQKCTNSLVRPAAAWRPRTGDSDIAIAYIEGIVAYSTDRRWALYPPAARVLPRTRARGEIFKLTLQG